MGVSKPVCAHVGILVGDSLHFVPPSHWPVSKWGEVAQLSKHVSAGSPGRLHLLSRVSGGLGAPSGTLLSSVVGCWRAEAACCVCSPSQAE